MFPRIPAAVRNEAEREIREYVKQFKWNVIRLLESRALFARLLGGDWDEEEFVIVPHGHKIVATNDEEILGRV